MLQVRNAQHGDVDTIYRLLDYYSTKEIILSRTKDDILDNISLFFVVHDSAGNLLGVVSYYDYGETLKEIRSLAVTEAAQRQGIGRMLIETIIKKIKENNSKAKIFTLTYVPAFFEKLGFIQVSKDLLPEKIWKDCANCPRKDCCEEVALILK
jgi:N-acetylglutamate synthase-like GNAT family acetyltransferase